MNRPKQITQEDWDAVDSPPLSDAMLQRMQPIQEAHPAMPARVRGPQKNPTKIAVSIRLSPDIVAYFKTQGRGWQKTINEILNEYVKNHQKAGMAV